MDPLNKIKFVDEDGTSVILDVPMTTRGERKEELPIDKMNEIEEDIEEKVEEEIKAVEEKVEEEIKAVEDTIENIEIKIKPPKGCCILM